MRFVCIGIRIHNGDIGRLKIAFLVIGINLQGFPLLTRINQFSDQPAKQIIFQRQFLSRTANNIFTFQVKNRQCLLIYKKDFVSAVQTYNRLMDTVYNSLQKLFGR